MTPSALCRLFKRSMHRTFTEYVNELRTNEACRLLATGGVRITSVAFEAGFENLSYFNRVFRRTRGMSPSAYRQSWSLDQSSGKLSTHRAATA
jgi:AraC-like DNA-binding protein